MHPVWRLFVAVGAVVSVPTACHAAACRGLLPAERGQSLSQRLITADDLVRLRDIGPVANNNPRTPILSLSPDGSKVAFQIRRADPTANTYCLGIAVMDLVPGAYPRLLDQGGEVVLAQHEANGFAAFTSNGTIVSDVPQWSPDGKTLAYLRRDNGTTAVWTVASGGEPARRRTHLGFDAESVAWSADGRYLLVSGGPGLVEAEKRIAAEGDQGFAFDDRWVPVNSNRPLVREPIATQVFAIDLTTDAVRAATPIEAARLVPPARSDIPAGGRWATASKSGMVAWVQPDVGDVAAPTWLHVRAADEKEVSCTGDACSYVIGLWWIDPGTLAFQRREGLDGVAIYIWRPGDTAPRRLLQTKDVFLGCQADADRLICGHEAAEQPRELVSVNLKTGSIDRLYDPNPEFARIRLGAVDRLIFKNAFGIETWADLVLPPDHQPGQRHPLIVVQYESRGFLRGGTGDEYPIQLFAAAGFAVLSLQRPVDYGLSQKPKTYDDVDRLDRIDWADRRSVLSSIETGIEEATKLGVADPTRVGLTGLSDGSSSAQFALIHSHMFKAVALSSCCDEPSVVGYLDGPVGVADMVATGYPRLTSNGSQFWKEDSIRFNAASINTPILVQAADREYLGALEAVMALRDQGKPVDMYVYPDEYHIRWQPAHRQATYVRSLDWLKFWLLNAQDPTPVKATQYRRWQAMAVRPEPLSAESSPDQ